MTNLNSRLRNLLLLAVMILFCNANLRSETFKKPEFRVIAFYTGKNDQAHISFVHEANEWFARMAGKYHFQYDSTNEWGNLNAGFLSTYQVVVFLDTRPEDSSQRAAFEEYMKNGGAWIGFHFAAFALDESAIPQNWDWYHNTFLGSGEYAGNTWKPTSAILRIEKRRSPVAKKVPELFKSSPNEWYKWKNDLRKNPDIEIIASIDTTSFPLGTGPKLYEIWHSGYYPVVWTNRNYKMLYINMGHNDIDYEHHTNKELSFTFADANTEKLVLNGLFWLAHRKK